MSSSNLRPLSTAAANARSESPDAPPATNNAAVQEAAPTPPEIAMVVDSLTAEVQADRSAYVKKRMEENRNKLAEITKNHHKLSTERRNLGINGDKRDNLLTRRQKEAIDMQSRAGIGFGSNGSSSHEDEHASVILLGSGIPVKNSVRPILLPKVEKLPPYTTWTFMDRNQRMTEDQSVVGRRRIYYDQNGGEALICSDSEEEMINDEEDKKEFVDSEDNIIRMTIEELGSSDPVFDVLAQRLSRKPGEVKARYEVLASRQNAMESSKPGEEDSDMSSFLDKDLEAAQDSFDNLFCRRCLVRLIIFDCKLHGCSQELIFPAEKLTWDGPEEENVPCGQHCYLQVQKLEVASSMQLNTERTPAVSSDASGVPLPRDKSNGPSLRSRSNPCKSGSIASKTQNVTEAKSSSMRRSRRKVSLIPDDHPALQVQVPDPPTKKEVTDFKSWRTMEKALFEKGLEMFGRNRLVHHFYIVIVVKIPKPN
ncbi:hypothetical protein OSB04_027260 [Centaurea solstitialis]|uniref:Histone-lysine N-methyltransferase CLF-like HTH domain-containing protein n=1 Tax=Centaurea solstitialis TaxID=347529 RepID=A0AA38W833_9ASTR|nr:hypothetical protein OSB04_027260 [Centaurea solstitialis]